MAFLRLFMLSLLILSLPAFGGNNSVARDKSSFPRCVENIQGKNLFLKYKRRALTRVVRYKLSSTSCRDWQTLAFSGKVITDEIKKELPEQLRWEIAQMEIKANEFREERTASDYIDSKGITTFTRELNRELTPKYGPIFSAEVFKELEERKPGNRDFRRYVLSEMRKESSGDFSAFKDTHKLVVSFGLGWSDDYGIAAPYYIKDFLSDIESMGIEVVYLKKNPFGTIRKNVERINPQIERELRGDKKIIFLSLCKGTPELFSALAQLDPELKKKIVGHVNLSGMLTGTFFADIAMSVIVPKILSPFMKIIPIKTIKDAGRMASSTNYMKSSIIAETLKEVSGKLPDNIPTVNVTGAPLSDRVMKSGSPMALILKYNYWQKFLVSANDGFIELPHTQVPENLAPNQVSLILDASHMLSDGFIEEFSLSEKTTRRKLYHSILAHILKAD